MIWLQKPPGVVWHSQEEWEEYEKSLEALKTYSFEDFLSAGHDWCWSLVGNIGKEHEYGEDKEIKRGTKHFTRGTKVCLAPVQWGDGYEKVVVIGIARKSRKYIEVVMQRKHIEHFRIQKIYKPAIVKRMIISEYDWWSDSDDDREDIIHYLESLAPEEAEKARQMLNDAI